MTSRSTRRSADRTTPAESLPGHVPPPLQADRALLGVQRAAVEVAAAQRRLALAVEVALGAGADEARVQEVAEQAASTVPVWMPGGGPHSFADG